MFGNAELEKTGAEQSQTPPKELGQLTHLEGLNIHLSFYDQDSEWIVFIQQELNHKIVMAAFAYF